MQDSHDSTAPSGGAAARRGGRGAPLKPLVDTSPLASATPNAGVRIGLLLRLHRFFDGHGRYPRQADMLDALLERGHHATTTALSRAESGTHRSSAILRGYEDVLGLPDGSLRAVADFLCRRQAGSPPDRDPVEDDLDVHDLSILSAAAQQPDPRPSDWYAFARAFRRPDTLGLPVDAMSGIAERLCDSLRTSGGLAWAMSLESLLLLAEGPYAGVVHEAVRGCPPLAVALHHPVARPRPAGRPGTADTAPTKDRRNPEWTWSHQASMALTSAHELPEQPVVDRLLYDVLADPSDDRALDAGITLAALPFADDAIERLRRAAKDYPHEPLRRRLARRLEEGWAHA